MKRRRTYPPENSESCSNCGRSVAFGSGWFVDRVPRLDTPSGREAWGVPHPEGYWICAECSDEEC